MSETKTMLPSVVIDGETVEPPSWLWVLAFAVGGADWALEETETENFKTQMRNWLADQQELRLNARIEDLNKRLELHKAELAKLKAKRTR